MYHLLHPKLIASAAIAILILPQSILLNTSRNGHAEKVASHGSAQFSPIFVATTGNDANPGTFTSPLRTLSAAASIATPGTDVIVRGGTYAGTVFIGNSGTPSARIRFYPYRSEAVVIDGTGTAANTDLVVISGDYIEFRNFEVTNATGTGIDAFGGRFARLIGNTIHESFNGGIFVGAGSTADLIQNNTVYHNVLVNSASPHGTFWNPAITADAADNTQIIGNTVYTNYGEGIDPISSVGALVTNNTVYDNFSVEIYLDNAKNTTVTYNLIYSTGNAAYFTNDGKPAVGIASARETTTLQLPLSGNTIQNNIVISGIYGIYYANFQQGGGMQNNTITHNTIVNQTDNAIFIEPDAGHSGNVVNSNIFYSVPPITLGNGPSTGFTFSSDCWFSGSVGNFGGSGDVLADPQFTTPGAFTVAAYKLQAGSPCTAMGRQY